MIGRQIYRFVIACCAISFCSSEESSPEVTTPLGNVRGLWKTSTRGQKYAAFEGIPYAKPPVGDLRFEEPQPISPWVGTWVADTPRVCLQATLYPTRDLQGEEDCLYLNVYVPAELLSSSKKLEVIVLIHGGAFMVGAGHIFGDPGIFMGKDVVFVTINYRLGILGFLSTEDDAIPGNNGMKDQVLALKWIKDNIESFGGNPDSVTITGLSAGGASVHLQYLSPLAKGLFHRGISQSGTALAPWVIKENPLRSAKKLGALLGCPDGSTRVLKDCLKQRPAWNLLNQLKHFFVYGTLPFSPFAPVIEKPSSKAFLSEEPYKLLKEGNINDVPWVTSTTRDEGLFPTALYWSQLEEINERWEELLCDFLDCNDTLPKSKRAAVSKEILNYYLGPGEEINKKNFMKYTQILTDRLFTYSSEQTAKMQAKVAKSPVYYYLFSYLEGENKAVQFFSGFDEIQGVSHGEDGLYSYGILIHKPFSEKDNRLIDAFQNMFYSFASTGKPSFGQGDSWQPTGSESLTYLNVVGPDDIKLQEADSIASSDFWSRIKFSENEHNLVKDEL